MASGTTVMALYLAPINLWVEDTLTQEVLTALWRDTRINVMSAGSEDGLKHLVGGAGKIARASVFGVVDRDLKPDNYARWADSTTRLFRLPAHEVENLLLDFPALSRVSGKATASSIEK